MRRSFLLTIGLFSVTVALGAQASNPLDTATINKIRGEAIVNSQAMETHWWLSEVFGPRATGTPGTSRAPTG